MEESKMDVDTESVKLTMSNELIKEALKFSMKAHSTQYYQTNSKKHGSGSSTSSSSVLIIACKGSMEVKDFYLDDHFGETNVDSDLLPSLRRIGEGQLAKVNGSVLQSFKNLLTESKLISEVEKALKDNKKILFTGHSSGGAIASLATLWMLDQYTRKQKIRVPIACVTFGSPLIGDRTLTHAVQREKWAGHFTHFVMERDIVPRMMLAPKRSIQKHLPNILNFYQQKLNPVTTNKSPKLSNFFNKKPSASTNGQDQLLDDNETAGFLESVLLNASTVASHDAYDLMEPTDSLKETLSADFVKVSPYRPFGHYVFCTRGEDLGPNTPRQQLLVQNPNAVLQLLFYFMQLPNEDQDLAQFARESLTENLSYEKEVNINGLHLDKMVNLSQLNEHLLTSEDTTSNVVLTRNKALFELAASAKWCLLAVEEAEKRKERNMNLVKKSMRAYKSNKIDPTVKIIEDMFDKIHEYKIKHRDGGLDYYQAFKLQDEQEDFKANVDRLEQAKIWDVVIEMVVRKDLPDEFEVWDELVDLATQFRRLYEPLDIANYYRHDKGDDTKMYMAVRPKRYKFTQRWYEHANVMKFELESESNFVAVVEELMREVIRPQNKTIEEVKMDFENIKKKVEKWKSDGKIAYEDVFWGELILSELKEKLA